MDMHYPTMDCPATPEYVLAVLRDMHRQQCPYDPEADAGADLSLESTVADWRAACDLMSWRELGHACNQMWDISCSDAEWREVLEPADRKRLAGVCRMIARHTSQPHIRPARLLGSTCVAAGAFLTIRSLLHRAGAPGGEIAPSTLLAPYARQYTAVFLGPVSRLAPGALPLARIRTPVYHCAAWGLFAGMLCLVLGECIGLQWLAIVGGLMAGASNVLAWYAARYLLPASVSFDGLRTFRDLAVVVAEGRPVAPSGPGR